VPGEASFLSRFTLKFVEIVAAGVATAVSGYIVAHLSGFFPGPAPAVVQAPALQAAPSMNATAQSTKPVSVDTEALRLAPQPDLKPAAVAPARATADVTPAPARKPVAVEPSAPETKPHEAAETKPHDAAETKSRSTESLEAQVRAALAKGDSAKPAPAVQSRQAAIPLDVPRGSPPAEAQPRPPEAATGAIAVTPRTADAAPQQAPVLAEPPAAVEIKTLPVAGVDTAPAPEPAPQAQAEAQPAGNDFFSAIKHIPDFLSPESHPQVPADKAPRPPMPVGQ
jgi:hypothetical protein